MASTRSSVALFMGLGLACLGATAAELQAAAGPQVELAEGATPQAWLIGQGGEGGEGAGMSEGQKANASFQDKLTPGELLTALRAGGHVIYFRHAQTSRDYADQADKAMKLSDCSTQRQLSAVGVEQAKEIGAAFRAKGIPVGVILASQYCRAWKTADLAFGRHQQEPLLNFLPFESYTEQQEQQMKANLTPLLAAVPKRGTNTVIVGHDDLFEAATGIYPEPQGMAYVLTPDGRGGFTLVANMLPGEWAKL
jgi:phosphohistidine phosphatase SixA